MSSRRKNNVWANVDWLLVGIYGVLVMMGWINIYAATYNPENHSIFDFSMSYGKQAVWIGAAFFLVFVIQLTDSRFFEKYAWPFFGVTLLLLAAVLVFGKEIKGNKSWIELIPGVISIQPAEFAKIGTSLAMAKLLTAYNLKMKDFSTRIKAFLLLTLPVGLIMLQPDTGSALVYSAFIFVLYREGLSGNFLLIGFFSIILFVSTLLFKVEDVITTLGVAGVVIYSVIFWDRRFLITGFVLMLVWLFVANGLNLSGYFIAGGIVTMIIGYTLTIYFGKELKRKKEKLLFFLIFMCSVGFCFSVGYVFENVLKDHQRTRITILLGEEQRMEDELEKLKGKLSLLEKGTEEYKELAQIVRETKQSLSDLKRGAGWNVNQSKIAIGSGGFWGKGFLQGTQTKYNFVPEQSTDFIFCTVGEEWGFLGSTFVILTYLFFMFRLIIVAERQKSRFARIYAYSIVSIFFIHFSVNISMVLGLAPVIGIPLPFFSYGGSSLWGFTILLFILIKLDSDRMHVLR